MARWSAGACACCAVLIAGSSHARPLELRLTHAVEAGQRLCATVVLRAVPKDGRSDDQGVLRVEATVPGRVTLELEPAQAYVVTTEGDQCWTVPVEVAPRGPAALDLEVWPAGRASGALKGAQGEDLGQPIGLEVSALLLGGEHGRPGMTDRKPLAPAAVALVCTTKEATFDCVVPASTPMGLRVALPGWVPWYAWDVEGEPGGRIQLGTISLARGASLSGWVLAEGASQRATAFAQPVGADRLSERQQATLRRACQVARNGHLQCRDLAPGQWTVVVEPPPGFGGERRSPVEVKAGEEARLDEPDGRH